MDCFMVLAQTTAGQTTEAETVQIVPIELIWEQISALNLLEALTFVSFGAVCLVYGWRVFKVLVVLSFALLGLAGGMLASVKLFDTSNLWGGIIGMVLLAVLAVPLMRYAVSILGAVAGGTLTAGLWYACALPEQYLWAGGLIGVVAGGMISFIIFKIAVMLFSSLGGGALMTTGLLAIFYLYSPISEQVKTLVLDYQWFLPLVLLVPTAVGVIVQNKLVKGSPKWEL